ncbi:MAG: SGNH/GDSL hydrolase family protein [bacterium]|nr:SGNH/GDSL hydrolase family protein [bacterium]
MIANFKKLTVPGVEEKPYNGQFVQVNVVSIKAVDPTAKTQPERTPTKKAIKDVEGLPRVLLIGDSISIGYTVATRTLLKGKVNLHRIPTNGGPTTRGLSEIDKWLGDKKWDVIHFNWGLHDLKYMGPKGENLADPKDAANKQQVPPAEYAKNLRKLVERLKKTKAKLIWTTTTPVAKGTKGRVHGHSAAYNKIARKIMDEHKIAIDDLYTLALGQLDKIQRPKNVHFTPEGSKVLAHQVANSILKALGKPELPKPKPEKDTPKKKAKK